MELKDRLDYLEEYLPILEGFKRFEELKGTNKSEASSVLKKFK